MNYQTIEKLVFHVKFSLEFTLSIIWHFEIFLGQWLPVK